MMCRSFECAGQNPDNVEFHPEFPLIENAVSENQEESDIYYYHTDHLGSSSWITYTDGSVTQHMQSLPFGEPFIDQRATSYDIRFKFTGKEMDLETGYQYFGARYYNSDISVWLSVDPLSFLYPSTSPYNYVENNPIRYRDPNGMYKDPTDADKARDKAVKKYGEDNVGRRYYDSKKEEYGFRISKDGFAQHKPEDVPEGYDASASKSEGIFSNSDYRNYNKSINKSNRKIAKQMTYEWDQGVGPTHRLFYCDDVSNAMRDAWKVNKARDYFYDKYKGEDDLTGANVIGYSGKFGLKGLIKAGSDPIEQFVGSYRVNIHAFPESGILVYIITNRTSMKSFLYGAGPQWERSSFKLNGNTYQTYVFFERIDYSKL